jgi:hypothetical protein
VEKKSDMKKVQKEKVSPRFELGSSDSESEVLTITPRNLASRRQAALIGCRVLAKKYPDFLSQLGGLQCIFTRNFSLCLDFSYSKLHIHLGKFSI